MQRAESYLLIDGRNLLWRSTSAFDSLQATGSTGRSIDTGGMYGFMQALLRLHDRYGGRVVIGWEGRNNFRYKIFPAYKPRHEEPGREEAYKRVNAQEKKLKRLLKLAGVPQYLGEGCEADDVLATLALRYAPHATVRIYTMDSDLRQVVRDNVCVVSASWGGDDVIYDTAKVKTRHGVAPKLVPLLKALAGDTSDGIPGVDGVGEKTAAKLVNAYPSLPDLLKAAKHDSKSWPVAPRVRGLVSEAAEVLPTYMELTTVLDNATLRTIRPVPDEAALRKLFVKYQFKTLIPSLSRVLALGE